jgi:two-component system nitrate/nitrite response regulator NarL
MLPSTHAAAAPAPAAGMIVPCRVMVLVDVRLYREGLVRALHGHPTCDVVGSAAIGVAGLELLAATRPAIVLLEAAAAGDRVLVHSIRSIVPQAKIIAFPITDEAHDAIRCAEAGAAGYVSSEASIDELVSTIVRVADGEFPCSPHVAALLAGRVSSLAAQCAPIHPASSLTSREREVLRLIDEESLSNKEIAGRLGIGVSTVKNHVHHILEKTRVTRRAQAVAHLRDPRSALARRARVVGADVAGAGVATDAHLVATSFRRRA